jgi:D-amino-acid dehydrogenase
VIIGGGAIGLCSAYYLSKNGASVTVVDMGEMGHGSSLHNAGYISPSHFVPLAAPGVFTQGLKWMLQPTSPLYIKPRLNPDFLGWALRFARACNRKIATRATPVLLDLLLDSSKLTLELSREKGMNFELTNRGITVLYFTEKSQTSLLHEHEFAQTMHLESKMLDNTQLHEEDPGVEFRARGGWHMPVDSHLTPSVFVKNLTDYLEQQKVVMRQFSEFKGFVTEGDKVVGARVGEDVLKAHEFILAAGAWSPALIRPLGITMYLEAGKGYSATFRNPPVKPMRPYILSERRIAVTPFSDSLRFAGTMEIAGISPGINRPRVEAILNAVPLYFNNIPRPEYSSAELWAGLRPVTPDGLPYVGRFREFSNLIAATGHAMLGMSLAAVTGRLVEEIVSGKRPSHDLTLLDPNRYD